MNLPLKFTDNIIRAFPKEGQKWLAALPDLLEEAASCWNLTLGEPFLLSYNYVCSARRSDGSPAVLKIGIPDRELSSEINTLRFYNGNGACLLYESDPGNGMLLLEHLRPGTMLCGHADDEAQTLIAAELMQKLWRNVPPEPGPFLLLSSWFEQLEGLRSRFGGGTGPYPEKTIAVVEGMIKELFAEDRPQVLLHGDYHHFNILLSDRGWLAIDPKGVIGAPEYESGPLLMNPWGHMPDVTEAIRRSERRIAILSERLGLDRQRLLRWAICHSLLSSYWDVQEDGSGGEYSFAWTEIFLRLKIK